MIVCMLGVCMFLLGSLNGFMKWCPLFVYEISYFFKKQSVVILFGMIQAHYLFVVQFLIFFKDVINVLKVSFTFYFFLNFASFHELYDGVF